MKLCFDKKRKYLLNQFSETEWIEGSGISSDKLYQEVLRIEEEYKNQSKAIIKAKTFEMIVNRSRIAIDKDDIFQDKLLSASMIIDQNNHWENFKGNLFAGSVMVDQRNRWEKNVQDKYLKEETQDMFHGWNDFGSHNAQGDYGHTSANTRRIIELGFTGLLKRVEDAAKKEGLTKKQKDFYESCNIVLNSYITIAKRLSKAIEPYNKENSQALLNISEEAPKNIYEAMQILVLYFFMHEYVAGTRVRTLGRIDVLLYPFYKNDIESGRFTKEEIREMMKFFLHKFWIAKVPFDIPLCLGGLDKTGKDVTNDISYLLVDVYNELNIYSPKIHIRVSDKTPERFIKLVLSCIRGGNSSFVFVNDNVAIEGLRKVGLEKDDAIEYVPIGCYEPASWGVEIGCTGNGGINLVKAIEYVITGGKDLKSGKECGLKTGEINSYEEFITAVKEQIKFLTNKVMDYVVKIEKHYDKINPDPILSCQYDKCIEKGIDAYEGGAKYNNSSINFYCIASLTDSITAVKKLVFDKNLLTFEELREVLKNDWSGGEKLQVMAKKMPEKYGNNNEYADTIAVEMAEYCANLVNRKPNGRCGVFKASIITIDHCFSLGERTMATPDGRNAGEPLSKNFCATTAMDRNGITALINSVTKIPHSEFSNGSVLDVVIHPTAVEGEDGLNAFYGILKTYMNRGGMAMHGNVFNAEDLKKAQKEPEKYKNLQVRLCGWNVYFVNLSKIEQDAFIKQAENNL